MRPHIGIPTQTLHSIEIIPRDLPQSVVMNQRYYIAASKAGAVPWLIPLLDDDEETLRLMYDRLDGILLPGGIDVDPALYGEAPHPKLGSLDPARDRVEIILTRWAAEDGKPVLGLCRGLQIINVALGGTLYQDLADQVPESIKHDYYPTQGFARDHLSHDVALASGSRLRHAEGADRIAVNSMHHQGVKTLGRGLVASATAPDGVIEAAESAGEHFLVGVQWHPEAFEMTNPHTRHVFQEFIAAAEQFGRRAA